MTAGLACLALAVAGFDPAPGVAPAWVEGRYRAAVLPEGLRGEATWRAWPARPGALVALDPLSIALEPGPARLVPTPGGAAARLPPGGAVRAAFSARATPEPGADRYELLLPPAPVATLELDLPADRTLEAPGALVGEPVAGGAGRRSWPVAFGGAARLELVVRRPPRRGDPPPLARASVRTRVELAPGAAAVTATIELEPVRGPVTSAELRLDPRLRVTAVTGPGAPAWSVDGSTLTVRSASGPLASFAVAAAAAGVDGAAGWPVPAVAVAGALPGEEVVEVVAGPDLAWRGLDPGGYRVIDARAATLLGFERGYSVTLARDPARPAAAALVRAEAVGPGFATTEDISWSLTGRSARGLIRLRVGVTRGPLTRLGLRVPAGFALGAVSATPADAGLMLEGGPGPLASVRPSRPLATGQAWELAVELVGPAPGPGEPFAPPDLVPVGAREREGALSVCVAPGSRLFPPGAGDRAAFRGRPPRVAVTPAIEPEFVSQSHEIALGNGPDGWEVAVTLRLRAAGPLPAALVGLPPGGWSPEPGPRDVTAEVDMARRLALAAGPLPGVGLVAGPDAAVLRLTPAAGATESAARFTRRLPVPTGPVRLRLPAAFGAARAPASARLTPDLAAGWVAEASGGEVKLRPRPAESPGGWSLAGAERVADLAGGRPRVTLRFAVAARPPGRVRLPLRLPAGAVLRGARVAGRPVDAGSGPTLDLPLPAGEGVAVEVVYDAPPLASGPAARLDLLDWALPGGAPAPARVACGPDYRPWPALGDSGATGPAAWVVRADWLRAAGAGLALLILAAAVAGRGVGAAVALGLILGGLSLALPPGWGVALTPGALAGLVALALRPRVPPGPGVGAVSVARLASTVSAARPAVGSLVVLLAAAAARGQPPESAAVADASYEFDAADPAAGTLRGVARFAVDAPGPGGVRVPLGGARLTGARLGTDPVDVAGTESGYVIELPGAGRHEVALSFALPVRAAGPEREARLVGPNAPTARVTLRAPPGAESPDVPSRRGVQTALPGERPGVRADHGAGPVTLRWRAPSGDAAAPQLVTAAVTVATVWDATPGGATGVVAALVRPEGGRLGVLTFALPAGVEPGELRLAAAEPVAVAESRLSPGPGPRRLRVTLREPVAGRLTAVLRLALAPPPPGEPAALPAVEVESAGPTEGYLLLRGAGPLAPPDRKRLIDFPADEVARRFVGVPELALAERPAERAFQRLPGPGRAELRAAPEPPRIGAGPRVDLSWAVGESADYDAAVTVGRAAPAGLVELPWPDELPVAEVRAAGLTAWERPPGLIRLWLARPAREVAARVAGSLPLTGGVARLPANPSASGSVAVRPAPGWEAVGTPDADGHLRVARSPAAAPPRPVAPRVEPVAAPPAAAPAIAPAPPAVAPDPATESPAPGGALAVAWLVAAGLCATRAGRLPRRERLAWVAALTAALALEPAVAAACAAAATALRLARGRGGFVQ